MNTPICDFVRRYNDSGALRLHMPGHKGHGEIEKSDITEIIGADSLYEADGIIRESENNASTLFECPTFYSVEGSSQCIRAMLFLAVKHAKSIGKKPLIAAGRNAHKVFISAAALIDFEILWLYSENDSSYLSCTVSADSLEKVLKENADLCAVYITTPDYLGNMCDIKALSEVCKKYGVLLLVDCAHGAYLKFLPQSMHPMDLGADMCCASAHKTLPALTGGAYLHTGIKFSNTDVKNALMLFGSTSPSYLILASLDKTNVYIAEGYSEILSCYTKKLSGMRERLKSHGYEIVGCEPMKLTICPKSYGYTGYELADELSRGGIVCEFADPDYLVLMFTPEISYSELDKLEKLLTSIERKMPITERPPALSKAKRVMSVREALFSDWETVACKDSLGKVLSTASIGCPPAVPIVVSGEMIDRSALECFKYYGIKNCTVVREK